MKSRILSLLALATLFLSPVALYAIDPHDTQVSTVTAQNTTTTASPQTFTITSLTATGIGSGTNSYVISANVSYEVPSGPNCKIVLSKTVSAVRTELISVPISIEGRTNIMTELESVANGTVFKVEIVANTSGTPIKVPQATLLIVGLDGTTS